MSEPEDTNFWLMLALWGAGLGAAAQFGKISVIYDHLTMVYGGGPTVGFIVSVVGMVGLVLGTTAGLVVQRLGYRRVLVGALMLASGLSLVQAALPPLAVMMATRVLEGLSHLAIVVVGPVLIAQVTARRHQGFAMTLWSSFFGLSFALTAWLGRPLVASYGAGAMFLAHAVYMGVFAAVLARMIPSERRDQMPGPAILRGLMAQHLAIYRSPSVAAPALGFFFYTVMFVAMLTLVPPLFGAPHQPLLAGLMPLTSIAVSLTLGVWLLRWIGAVRLVQVGFACGLGAMLLLWLFWEQGEVSVALALALAGALGLVQGASFASIPALNTEPAARARAAGAVAQLGNMGTTTGTPILAVLIAGWGIDGLLGFAVPFCIGGLWVTQWLLLRRRRL